MRAEAAGHDRRKLSMLCQGTVGQAEAELMKLATYAQTDPGKLFDPAVIGNVSANDVMAVTNT